MSRSEGVVWCDGCGVEITWAPLVKPGTGPLDKHDYCCEDCFRGLRCRCSERAEMDDDRRSPTGTPEETGP